MNLRTQTAAVLTATFLSGAVIGALVSGAVRRRHIEQIVRLREPDRFVGFAEQFLKPTDAQRDTVQEILIRNHERCMALREMHIKALAAVMDTLHQKLSQVLTKEQIEAFSRFEERMPPPARVGYPPFPSAGFRAGLLESLESRLRLTRRQSAEVKAILSAMPDPERRQPGPPPGGERPGMPPGAGWIDSINTRIVAILTPEQRVRFEEFRKERAFPPGPFEWENRSPRRPMPDMPPSGEGRP
jgi:hypothetical protein